MTWACRLVRSRLTAFAGGDLAPERAREVRAHLQRCNACRTLAGAQLRAQHALRRAAVGALPVLGRDGEDAFFALLHADVLSEVARSPRLADRPWRRRLERLAGVAAAVGLFLVGFVAARPRPVGLYDRDPIAIDAPALPRAPAAPSGPTGRQARGTPLRPLGFEDEFGPGQGMMGRLLLRSLEQEEADDPLVRPAVRARR